MVCLLALFRNKLLSSAKTTTTTTLLQSCEFVMQKRQLLVDAGLYSFCCSCSCPTIDKGGEEGGELCPFIDEAAILPKKHARDEPTKSETVHEDMHMFCFCFCFAM
ncbi:unnamed protein product [Amoebophrya sp. A120]|nr:unnamed protein product [Amoebophrya sp. A120]|eukprot:GSA120T00007658001.1